MSDSDNDTVETRRYVIGPDDDTESVVEGIREMLETGDKELVAVEAKPLSREQHDANQALVNYLEDRR